MKLKPCPFCGNKVELHHPIAWLWNIYCSKCPVEMQGRNEQELVKAWNRRVVVKEGV
jgi:Lar family restriction alleviation protein